MKNQAITLGRVGILLPIAIIIPFLGALAGLGAAILLLISHYNFSKVYAAPSIFKNALTGTIVMIAGNILGFVLIGIGVGLAAFTASDGFDASQLQEIYAVVFQSGLAIFGAILLIASAIIGYYFIFQSLKELAATSGVNLFRTAGLLYFIGAIASIIIIGGIVVFVAWILHIVAYFSINGGQEIPAAENPQ